MIVEDIAKQTITKTHPSKTQPKSLHNNTLYIDTSLSKNFIPRGFVEFL